MSPNPSPLSLSIRSTIRRSPVAWAHACHIHLRPYQVQIARAVKDSVLNHRGLTIVIILPRQSGKNELQAHLLAWLLYRYAHAGGRIVSVSPPSNPRPSYAWIQSTIANVHRREIKERVKFRALCKHPI